MDTFIIYVVYAVPSLTLYGFVISAVVHDRENFNKSFFKLYAVSAVINMWSMINGFFGFRLSSIAREGDYLSKIYLALPLPFCNLFLISLVYIVCVQFFLIFLISLNRLTCILFPVEHEKIWLYLFFPSLVFSLLEPFIHVYPLLYNQVNYVREVGLGLRLKAALEAGMAQIYKQEYILALVVAFLTLVASCASLVGLYIRTKSKVNAIEVRLFFVSLVNCLLCVVIALALNLNSNRYDEHGNYVSSPFSALATTVTGYMTSLMTLIDPYLLIALNYNVRHRTFNRMRSVLYMDTFIIYVAYSVPSLILYGFVLSAVVRDRENFNKSFFKLYAFSAVVNFFSTISGFFAFRLTSISEEGDFISKIYLSLPSPFCNFFLITMVYIIFVQFFLIFLISLNRLTCILFPVDHEKIWSYIFYPALAFSILEPFVHIYPLLYYPVVYVREVNLGLKLRAALEAKMFLIYKQESILAMVVAFLTSLASFLSLIGLYIRTKSKVNAIEVRLFIVSLINCLLCVVIAFALYLNSNRYDDEGRYVSSPFSVLSTIITGYMTSLMTLIDPYLLIALNYNIRRRTFNKIKTVFCFFSRSKTAVGVETSRNSMSINSQSRRTDTFISRSSN